MAFPETRRVLRYFDDWPTPGVRFIDIAPILSSPPAFKELTTAFANRYRGAQIDRVLGLEARGFFFAAPLALALGLPLVPVRKPGKLPGRTVSASYTKEYAPDSICVQEDAIPAGARVLVVDDILATGGTLTAAADLVAKCGGIIVELACAFEIVALHGRDRLPPGVPFYAFIKE
jgi:adenine phosphoribosyltransferase